MARRPYLNDEDVKRIRRAHPDPKPRKRVFPAKHPGLFAKGYDARRNAGGKPFVKVHQRLAKVMADELDSEAPAYISEPLGLPEGSSFARSIARCSVLQASQGDISSARFVFECVEMAKTLNVHLNAEISEKEMVELRQMFRAKVAEEAERLTGNVVDIESTPSEPVSGDHE